MLLDAILNVWIFNPYEIMSRYRDPPLHMDYVFALFLPDYYMAQT